MITCPCCGGRGEIEERAPVTLNPLEFKIWDVVRKCPHGIDLWGLAERVYADRKDGGPVWAGSVLRVTIMKTNKRLAAANFRIVSSSRGAASVYKLQRLA